MVHFCPQTPVPLKQGKLGQSVVPEVGPAEPLEQRPNVLCLGAEIASWEMVQGSGLSQLSFQPRWSVSFPDSLLIPDNLPCLHTPRHFTNHFHTLISPIPGYPHNSLEG